MGHDSHVPTPTEDKVAATATASQPVSSKEPREVSHVALDPKSEAFIPWEGWYFYFLNIPDMIARSQVIRRIHTKARSPPRQWSYKRITLLGDAAHTYPPYGSHGANNAILDARALTECLTTTVSMQFPIDCRHQELVQALRTHEMIRRDEAKALQKKLRLSEDSTLTAEVQKRCIVATDDLQKHSRLTEYKRVRGRVADVMSETEGLEVLANFKDGTYLQAQRMRLLWYSSSRKAQIISRMKFLLKEQGHADIGAHT